MTPRIKWPALGALVMLWMGLVYIYVIDVPPPVEIPLKYQSGQTAAKSTQTSTTDTWEVKSLKAQARELPVTPSRNIFTAASLAGVSDPHGTRIARQKKPSNSSNAVPSTPTAPPPTPEELARQQEALAAQAAQEQERLRRQQLQEQLGQYRYLGYVNQNGVQKAFLGKGRELYIFQQGDILEGKFQVTLIEATTVKLLEADSNLEMVLKLKKEESSVAGT